MDTRRAYAVLTYNGHNIRTTLTDYATTFEYSDPSEGESDTISMSLADADRRWIGAWIPMKGDQVTASIIYENKGETTKTLQLDCGQFLLDKFSFSESVSGIALTISAISTPLDDAIKATERTKTWEQVTIKQMANDIANRYKMTLVYDAEDITIQKQQQDKETDISFLETVTKKYGLMLKTYKSKIVIYDREQYKKKETVATIDRTMISDFSWDTNIQGTYTACKIDYTDNKTNKSHTVSIGSGNRVLKLNDKASSDKEAQLLAKAGLANANHDTTTCSFTTLGNPTLVAGQTILLTGFAKLSGKYYINKKTDSLSGSGYTSTFECSFVNSSEKEVVNNAIDRLYYLKVLNNPSYWKKSLDKLESLSELFINAGTSIKTVANRDNTNTADYIKVLADRGVINSPEYWRKHKDFPYLEQLLINISHAIL